MKRIFSRLNGGHLDDAALAAVWTSAAASGGAASSEPRDPHLAACAECRVRYDAFLSWMEEIRSDAQREAADLLAPERLVAQQTIVMRRLEALERPARVIAFPKFPVNTGARSAPVRRWVAAAAAAGLIVGVGLGQLMDLRTNWSLFPTKRTVSQQPRPETRVRPVVTASSASAGEEALLLELEAAATPQYEALRAYDTLTPRAADFVQSSR